MMNKIATNNYIKTIKKAAEKGRLNALKQHKAFGVPIVTEKNGEIVEIQADEKLEELKSAL